MLKGIHKAFNALNGCSFDEFLADCLLTGHYYITLDALIGDCHFQKLFDAYITDSSGRLVDHSLEGDAVTRIGHEGDHGDTVADFLSVVEPERTYDVVRNAVYHQTVLKVL